MKFFLFLTIWSACAGLSKEEYIPCYGDKIFTHVVIPEQNKGIAVIFVPAPGYMDNQGRLEKGNDGAVPPEGVFEFYKQRLNAAGYTTVQFDKPGTGSSSGRLADEEELALLCAYAYWDSLENSFSGQYFIFSYACGGDYFRFAFDKMSEITSGSVPQGIIQFAGLTNWHGFGIDNALHVLTILGDTVFLSERIEKQRLENRICRDSVSKVLIMEKTDANLCSMQDERGNSGDCEYREDLAQTVLDWLSAVEAVNLQRERKAAPN